MTVRESTADPRHDWSVPEARPLPIDRTIGIWGDAGRRIGWTVMLLAVLLLVQSAFWASHVPWVLKAIVAGCGAFAVVRPAEALLLVAGLTPFTFAITTQVWPSYPFSFDEAIVLAFLAGYLSNRIRAASPSRRPRDPMSVASTLLAVVVLASAVGQIPVLQVLHDYPDRYASDFFNFLISGYLTSLPDPRPQVDGRAFVSIAGLLLQGLALFGCTRTLSIDDPSLPRRVTRVMVIAATGVSLLTLQTVLIGWLEKGGSFWSVMNSTRWSSPAIPSLNTAGPYLLLAAFAGVGTAAAASGRWPKLGWIAAGALCAGAMVLSGTRSAIFAGLAVAGACAVLVRLPHVPSRYVRRMALGAAALAVAIVATMVVLSLTYDIFGNSALQSLRLRAIFAETGVRMMASTPVTGVGIGQYANNYLEFVPEEIRRYYRRDTAQDAHNLFLWVGAELGLVGLGLFAWLILASLLRAWGAVRAEPGNRWRLALLAGLFAFVVTWLVGQPLTVPRVAFAFWMLLGAAVASADTTRRDAERQSRKVVGWLALAAAAVLIGTLPIRINAAIDGIDLSRIAYGFHPWEKTGQGEPFRWTGPRARFFVSSEVDAIDLPFPPNLLAAPDGAQVDVSVDGRPREHLELKYGQGTVLRIDAPPPARRFWRVDLTVSPTWRPRDVLPRTTDTRELGVPVGQVAPVSER
jgi:O-antigen ligase